MQKPTRRGRRLERRRVVARPRPTSGRVDVVAARRRARDGVEAPRDTSAGRRVAAAGERAADQRAPGSDATLPVGVDVEREVEVSTPASARGGRRRDRCIALGHAGGRRRGARRPSSSSCRSTIGAPSELVAVAARDGSARDEAASDASAQEARSAACHGWTRDDGRRSDAIRTQQATARATMTRSSDSCSLDFTPRRRYASHRLHGGAC